VTSASVAESASRVVAIRQGSTPASRTDRGGCPRGSIAARRLAVAVMISAGVR
jgi:hypothetical protein